MNQELVYTSAEKGLLPNKRGFCVVAKTASMSPTLQRLLESLSAYRHVTTTASPHTRQNPVVLSHLISRAKGKSTHILSRIADAGLDYSNRSNKLAHHIALNPSELAPSGPTGLMGPGVFLTEWNEPPKELVSRSLQETTIGPSHCNPTQCPTWEQESGDAGWAGVLIDAHKKNRVAYVVVKANQPAIELIDEAIRLLPADERWQVTFSTYFTRVPPGIECQWRFVLGNSPEHLAAVRNPQNVVLDLTRANGPATGKFAEAARNGLTIQRNDSTDSKSYAKTHSTHSSANLFLDSNYLSDAVSSIPPSTPSVSINSSSVDSKKHSGRPSLNKSGNFVTWIIATGILTMMVAGIVVATVLNWNRQGEPKAESPSFEFNDNVSAKSSDEVPGVAANSDDVTPNNSIIPDLTHQPPQASQIPNNQPHQVPVTRANDPWSPKSPALDTNTPEFKETPIEFLADAPTLDRQDVEFDPLFFHIPDEYSEPIEMCRFRRPVNQLGKLHLSLAGALRNEMDESVPGMWKVIAGQRHQATYYLEQIDQDRSRLMFRWERDNALLSHALLRVSTLNLMSEATMITKLLHRKRLVTWQSIPYVARQSTTLKLDSFTRNHPIELDFDAKFIEQQLQQRLKRNQFLSIEPDPESAMMLRLRCDWDQIEDGAEALELYLDSLAYQIQPSVSGFNLTSTLDNYIGQTDAFANEVQQRLKINVLIETENKLARKLSTDRQSVGNRRPKNLYDNEVFKEILNRVRREYTGISTAQNIPVPRIRNNLKIVERPRASDLRDLMIDLKNQAILERLEIDRLKYDDPSSKTRWKRPRRQLESVLDRLGTELQREFNRAVRNLVIPIRVRSRLEHDREYPDYLLVQFGELTDPKLIDNFNTYLRNQ